MFTSLLFVPGDDEKKQAKSCNSGADLIILDLEDSVAAGKKEKARQVTASALKKVLPATVQRYVRVNALDTGLTEDDLRAVMPATPDGIVLPKCNGPKDVQTLSDMMAVTETTKNTGATKIIAIVTETAQGVLSLAQGGWVHPRLAGMMWGAEDLAADLGASTNSHDGQYTEPFRLARNLCLFAARAADVMPIDTIYADYKDLAGLAQYARDALRDGFDAKAAIHPAQIEIIHKAFTPTAESIDWARSVVTAFESVEAGVASLNGKMLDMPHLRTARKILARIQN